MTVDEYVERDQEFRHALSKIGVNQAPMSTHSRVRQLLENVQFNSVDHDNLLRYSWLEAIRR